MAFGEGGDTNLELTHKNLGDVVSPTFSMLTSLITSEKTNITADDFYIDKNTITYSSARIVAADASDFFGSTTISFNGSIDPEITYDSYSQRVDAYNSTQSDSDTRDFHVTIGLGREAFLKSFTTLNLSYNAWAYNNHDGQIYENKSSYFSLNLKADSNLGYLYGKEYIGSVNWMKLGSEFAYAWIGDTLKLTLTTWTRSYASGWNAYWASAEARTQITKVYFS